MKLVSQARDDMAGILSADGVDCIYNGNTYKVFFLRDPEKNTDAYSGGVETTTAYVYGSVQDFGNVKHGDILTINGQNYKVMEKDVGDTLVVMLVARV